MPGIGKTTSIHCLAHQLLGDAYKEGVLELNASDERSLLLESLWAIIFADCRIEESMSFGTKSKHSLRRRSPFHQAGIKSLSLTKRIGRYYSKPSERVFDIDLVNSMTAGAQQALRRTMEIYSKTTRFCLACNMANKIIEPIQSRCAILRYAKLCDIEILKRLLDICEFEKVFLISGRFGCGLNPLPVR